MGFAVVVLKGGWIQGLYEAVVGCTALDNCLGYEGRETKATGGEQGRGGWNIDAGVVGCKTSVRASRRGSTKGKGDSEG